MLRRTLFTACLAIATVSPAQTTRVASPTTSPTVHDPSSVVRCGEAYYVYSTALGIKSWRSTDLHTWTEGSRVFPVTPSWFAEVVPGNRGVVWAPDVVRLDDADGERYLMYYSISTIGKRTSAIALATNRTLDASDRRYAWKDCGTVVRTSDRDDFNAIDPSVFHDARDGRLWLSFGSFWSGIRLIELDSTTGLRLDHKSSVRLAWKSEIEASFLTLHDGNDYLFVNWGKCCLGVKSTYEIRVGRSESVTGPYVDRDGVELVNGGGTPVLAGDDTFVGPGHASIVVDAAGRERLTGHFYDATDNGKSHLFIRPLTWDAAGWPVVGK